MYTNQSATELKEMANGRAIVLAGVPRELYDGLKDMT